MFDFKQANEWLKASNLGRWEVYPRSESAQAAEELQNIAQKQNRGKKHFEIKNASNIRNKNDTYVFIGADGTPAVYVLAFWDSDRVSLDDIWGCESSGAVEPMYIQAVKALTQTDRDFELKVENSAKEKVQTGDELNKEEKVFVQTFLPPQEGYEVQTGLIGGSMGFMSSSMRSMSNQRAVQQIAHDAQSQDSPQDPQQQNQRQRNQNPNDPNNPQSQNDPNDPNNTHNAQPNAQDITSQVQVFNQLALITIIKENLIMNSEQIRQVLESIEDGTAVEGEHGELLSVTFSMTAESFDQIEEFLNHPQNAQCGFTRGKKYIALRDKIKSESNKEENKEQTQETQEPANLPPDQQVQNGLPNDTIYQQDFDNFQKNLDEQLQQDTLPEPEAPNPETQKPKLKIKQFTEKNKRFRIKNEQIRTK